MNLYWSLFIGFSAGALVGWALEAARAAKEQPLTRSPIATTRMQ
jgi:Na+/H+-dicarboxylate symporter